MYEMRKCGLSWECGGVLTQFAGLMCHACEGGDCGSVIQREEGSLDQGQVKYLIFSTLLFLDEWMEDVTVHGVLEKAHETPLQSKGLWLEAKAPR